jgi:hypothetical protein
MDHPTPEQPPEETPARESFPETTLPKARPAPTPVTAPVTARERRVEARLRRLVGDDEPVIAWTQGWVSRQVRLHRVLAARTLDFAVLTDRNLLLFSTGFFTRRARRRVYASRLERISVADDAVRKGRRLRVSSRQAHPLWFELRPTERADAFADALMARVRAEQQE